MLFQYIDDRYLVIFLPSGELIRRFVHVLALFIRVRTILEEKMETADIFFIGIDPPQVGQTFRVLHFLEFGDTQDTLDDESGDVMSDEIVEVAVKTAKILSASKRSQILQNGSLLQFNGKVPQRTVSSLTERPGFR